MAHCVICNEEVDYPLTCSICNSPLCDTHHQSRNGKCESCTNSKVKLEKLRRSGLATYESCQFLFKLTYIDQVEGINKSNLWASAGNIMHDIFERDSVNPQNTEEELFGEYKKQFDELKVSDPEMFVRAQAVVKDDVYDKMLERGRMGIKNYLEYSKTADKILHAEQYVELQLDDDSPAITMTIDRINELPDGEFGVDDYKTGKTYYGKQLSNDIQPPIYILGVQKLLGKLPLKFTFVFTETGGTRTYNRVSDDKYECTVGKKTYSFSLHETKKRVKRIFAGIQNEQFNISQDVSFFFCENFCTAYQNGLCAGAQKQMYNNHW